MKTIVTHIGPDLDATTSSWLVKKFMPGWEEAEHTFVPAGTTLNGMEPDSDPEIIHVDTGFGKFDHHQTDAYTSASLLVYEYLVKEGHLSSNLIVPLERMIKYVNDIDHFAEVYFPDPTNDRYDFNLSHFADTFKSTLKSDHLTMETVMKCLDAIFHVFKNKVKAEVEIKKGFIFESKWGKTLAIETSNEETVKLAMKTGYSMVVRKDPERGFVRIKTLPKKELDLTQIYEILKKKDSKAFWFLHASKNMLLNGSSKNPNVTPSSLSIKNLIEIIKEM